ncbi:MAG TPA: ATP-dependent DNA ligase [Euzebyales bacterium]|nr:ATP-dependent DNA ligase [Euzebyales bacterium]
MLLHELVAVSEAVGATRARTRKVALLSEMVRDLPPDDRSLAVGYLTGVVPQGRVGIGYVAVSGLDVAAADEPTLRLADVDGCLTSLAGIAGDGSRRLRDQELTRLFARATASEQAFLRRLLIGELRHGALDGVMVTAIAAAAAVPLAAVRRAYMLSDDLAVVTTAALRGGADELTTIRLQVMRPVQPMLASSAPDPAAALGDDDVIADAKIDGARVQVHRDGERVAVFTRSLRDITDEVPGIVAMVRSLPVDAVILDGEAVSFRDDGRPEPFQVTMQRLGDDGGGEGDPSTVVRFFDCLHHAGDDLIDAPLTRRLAALDTVVPADALVRRRALTSAADAAAFFDEVVAAGFEGMVVKDTASPYEAGRRGAAWRKVKPSWTLDLVVLAIEWGSGRRRGWLSNLHLGARDPAGGFVMLGKTFKGMTDEMLAWQTERFFELETGRDRHVVNVAPVQVVEVAVDGVQHSSRYPGGVALRFARVRRYRDDKTADQADTIDTVRAIRDRT